MKSQFDCTEVVKMFLARKLLDQTELAREFQQFMLSDQGKMLTAEICAEALGKGASPTDLSAISIMYGMTIGVLLERQRIKRAS